MAHRTAGCVGRHPRTTAILAGGLIVAAAFLHWNHPTGPQMETPRSGNGNLTLDKVVVFPAGKPKRPATAVGAPVPAADSKGKVQIAPRQPNPGLAAPLRPSMDPSERPSPFPTRLPAVPRAVWLTGTIEPVRETPSAVRPTSHIELPMYPRRRVNPVSLREIEMRRRDRR
ncbi:MAG: hypothetical protein ACE5KM_23420 [Planctomycetaceae bacterium]